MTAAGPGLVAPAGGCSLKLSQFVGGRFLLRPRKNY